MHSDARGPSLLSANKEGFTSLWGYWALHLLGAALGHHIHAAFLRLAPSPRISTDHKAFGNHTPPPSPVSSKVLRSSANHTPPGKMGFRQRGDHGL